MPGYLLIKSKEKWWPICIQFKAYEEQVLPILQEDWYTQEAADQLVRLSGNGIKMMFKNRGKKDATGVFANTNINGWNDGEQFDHSPADTCSPINPNSSKAVTLNYYKNTPCTTHYPTKQEAIDEKCHTRHVYIWDGEKWEYYVNEAKKGSIRRNNVWRNRGK
jgi:hypothetical protein